MALQDSSVEVSEGYFESGGARLRYLAWRPRGRVVGTALLYHGFGGSSEMMGWIGVELARAGYLAVAYDARGHGKSSSTLSYDPSLLVEDCRALQLHWGARARRPQHGREGGPASSPPLERFAARSVGFAAAWLVFSVFVGGGARGTCWWSRT